MFFNRGIYLGLCHNSISYIVLNRVFFAETGLSKVDDHNTPKSDTHKLHKYAERDQENRDPLDYNGQTMDIENLLSTRSEPRISRG